jgi:hypothetical protein
MAFPVAYAAINDKECMEVLFLEASVNNQYWTVSWSVTVPPISV